MMELKPCPFCGNIPKLSFYKDESLWDHSTVIWSQIRCCDIINLDQCDDKSGQRISKIWNTRADLDKAVADEREACAMVCDKISKTSHDYTADECAQAIRNRGKK